MTLQAMNSLFIAAGDQSDDLGGIKRWKNHNNFTIHKHVSQKQPLVFFSMSLTCLEPKLIYKSRDCPDLTT